MKINRTVEVLLAPLFFFARKWEKRKRKIAEFWWHHQAIAFLRRRGAEFPANGEVWFRGKAFLRIEKGCTIRFGKHFCCNSGRRYSYDDNTTSRIWLLKGAKLIIGHHSGMTNASITAFTSVTIGNYVNIGSGTAIFDTNWHSMHWEERMNPETDVPRARTKPVVIKDHAFIGSNCTICKGVTIGEKAIVATGSVVVCDIPDGEVWGGNPARRIKASHTELP